MKYFEGRNLALKNRINQHLRRLTGINNDFYSELSPADFIELKTVYADINNVLTLKLTIAAANWLCKYFNLDSKVKRAMLNDVDQISPNAKGYDIFLKKPYKIVAEVKCISPVNSGNRFGAAQRNSILDDLNKLKDGKEPVIDTKRFYKFLFLVDIGEHSLEAITHLLKESKTRIETPNRIKRNNIKKYIKILNTQSINQLDKRNVYIKTLKIKHILL